MAYYGYCRVSTKHQQTERQHDNIKSYYQKLSGDEDVKVKFYEDSFTGTKISRPNFDKMLKAIESGDTIVFDEISRMSRNAEDGFKLYKELYEKGVHLVFLKERSLDTDNFTEALKMAVPLTGTSVDCILKGVNEYLMILAEKQIYSAFAGAQHEVEFLHQRVSEGMEKNHSGEKISASKTGKQLKIKKKEPAQEIMLKHCKDFGGNLSDAEVMKLTGLSRNTYYKYKGELKQGKA